MLFHITDKSDLLDKINLYKNKLIVVEFSASWSGRSKRIESYVKMMADQDEVVFLVVDVDECLDLSLDDKEWPIVSLPTFFIIKEGVQIESVAGCDDAVKFMELIYKYKERNLNC